MTFEPRFLTSVLGSLPHTKVGALCRRMADNLDIPAWPQFPRRTFRESMYVQFGVGLPNAVLDEQRERLIFDTTSDLVGPMEAFYERYLAGDVDSFALPPDCAAGFYAMLDALRETEGSWAKGQVTGPVSFGLTVTDQDRRPALYHEMLADAIVKNTAMNARWQIRQLRSVRPDVILFVDEPYMAAFGSAYVSLSREQVIEMLEEVFDAIHAEGALAGVHCCANTDWSVLLSTTVDILNLDAYGYLENLALYPAELRAFLDRGGVVAWGIVPTGEEIADVTPESTVRRFYEGFALISHKAKGRGVSIAPEEFTTRSIVTPGCGLGPTTVDIAERVIDVLV